MKVIGVIPSRFGSSRFEGKPLKLIAGKPLLQRVIEGAKKSKKIQELIVATDDERIQQLAQSCGVRTVMTDSDLPSGTDRVWAAAKDLPSDVVINIQGDEPLLTGFELDQLVGAFEDAEIKMATLGRSINIAELQNPNVAKIVLNNKMEAIYFSRFPIPHSRRSGPDMKGQFSCLKHVGLYGYTKKFLGEFCAQKPVDIEGAEGLEQLRALYLGAKIKVILTEYQSWGVDTPEDVIRVEEMLRSHS